MSDFAFLSYSRDDSAFALQLAEDMKAAGFAIWIDQIDIAAGERWDKAVEAALAGASALIVVLSPASVESNNVNDEVALSIDENKLVIPLLRQDCKIPLRLRRLQYVDFRSDYERGKQTLAGRLTALQGRDVSGAASIPSPKTAAHPDVAPNAAPSGRNPAPKIIVAAVLAAAVAAFIFWPRSEVSRSELPASQPAMVIARPTEPSASSESKASMPPVLATDAPPVAPRSTTPTSGAPGRTAKGLPSELASAGEQAPKAAKPSRGTPPEPAILLQGTYKGLASNLTAGLSAGIELRLEDHAGSLTGGLLVSPPLGGSGPLKGHRNGSTVDFEVAAPGEGMVIVFHGETDGDRLSGAYVVKVLPELRQRMPNLPEQLGTLEARR